MAGDAFRAALERDEVVVTPLVHDALSARVAEMVGFDVLGISGYGVSLSFLGLPDAGYLSFEEMLKPARNVAASTDVPVWVDVDTGYGNAVTARRTARECIAGSELAGLFIEDQVAPKRCGHVAGKRVVPREEAVGKVEAVCDLRDDLDDSFVVIARTDARGAADGGLEEAIARGNAFHDAGADVVFVEAPRSHEEFRRIGREVDGHLMCMSAGVPGEHPDVDLDAAAEYGFDLYGLVPTLKPAMTAMYDVLSGIREEGPTHLDEFEDSVADHPVGDLHEFAGFDDVVDLERRYLPDTERGKYDRSIGYTPGDE